MRKYVKLSYQLISLIFFRYALSVFENQNLAQLWNFTEDFKILHGTIQFHNNPRLCYQTIMDMAKSLGLLENTTEHDVSQFSNGNKAVCKSKQFEIWREI